MIIHVNGRKPGTFWPVLMALILGCIMILMSGCGPSSTTQTTNPPTSTQPPSASTSGGFQGPTDFFLNNTLNFSQARGTSIVNGTTTPLSSEVVQRNVIGTFQHTLFVVDATNNISVYTNGSSSALAAQTTKQNDGSVIIKYTHPSKSGTTTFNGVLLANQMHVTYTTETMTSAVVNGQTFSGGNTTASIFTTPVHWVSPKEIPPAPTNGHYQFTSDGGVNLTWAGNATGYNIYRFVLTDKAGFRFLSKSSTTSYSDESQTTISNAKTITGIAYTIYAVGPTGLENPSGITLSISSLG